MKLRYRLLFILLILGFVSICSRPAQAQVSDIGDVLQAGASDAEQIMKAYLSPVPSGFGSDINSGWISSAGTHQTLGFDLQIRGALSFIPRSDQTFDLKDLTLNKIRAVNPSNTISPTAGGNDELGPEIVVEDEGSEVARFNLPKGSGYSVVPSPMIQASLGLVRDTDIIARFVPEVTIDDSKFNLIGFGLKHGLNQWLPGGDVLPIDISIMGGFTQVNLNTKFDLTPEPSAIPNPQNPEAATASFDNQKGKVSLNTFTLKALVGKNLPFISFYGGVGYETSTMDVDVVGNYPVSINLKGVNGYDVVQDPFSYEEDGQNKFSLLGGATLKMAFFHLFGEFTLAKYSSVSAGIGFSFR